MKKWLIIAAGVIVIGVIAMLLRDISSDTSIEKSIDTPAQEPPAQLSNDSAVDQQDNHSSSPSTGAVAGEDLPVASQPDSADAAPFPIRPAPFESTSVELEFVDPASLPQVAAGSSPLNGGTSAGADSSQILVIPPGEEASVPFRSATGGNPPERDQLLAGPGEGNPIDPGLEGPGENGLTAPGPGPGEGWEGGSGPAPEDSPSPEVFPPPGENRPEAYER